MLRQMLNRFPPSVQAALRYEMPASVGFGAYLVVFSISLVVLETILQAELWCSALLGALFFGSSLFSPLVAYAGRFVPMQRLVVVPNFCVGALLLLTMLPWAVPISHEAAAILFTLTIGGTFLLRALPRVAEMNMYRVLYPVECRARVVGMLRAIAALSGLGITTASWWLFAASPLAYPLLYVMIAGMLWTSAWLYGRIPVPPGNPFSDGQALSPTTALRLGFKVVASDRRFIAYQAGFAIAGLANHIGLILIPRVLEEHVHAGKPTVTYLAAVQPMLLTILSSPFWGRFLDRSNPMTGRAIFNGLQAAAFGLYAYGGLARQVWPFFVGTAIHGISSGGGMINWLTGSLYFAAPERVSLYNGVHVFLTGVRGFIGPLAGLMLFTQTESIGSMTWAGAGLGAWVFVISAGLSVVGMVVMAAMSLTDPGPREFAQVIADSPPHAPRDDASLRGT